jgi:hypothetical protein
VGSPEQSHLDWKSDIVLGIVFGIIGGGVLFGWLTMVKSREGIIWLEPFTWTAPFFPMRQYPLRFWALGAYNGMIAGGVGFLIHIASHKDGDGLGITLFLTGLGIWITLKIWMRLFIKHPANQ